MTEGSDHENSVIISSNKMLGPGLSSAIQAKPELEVQWAGQLPYPQAIVGVEIYWADVMILDIVDRRAGASWKSAGRSGGEPGVKILLLVRPEQAAVRKVAVEAKNTALADDFVFYDSSLTYLLAKLAAF